jgi:probable HAF family extracellular repeat protein
MYSLGGAGNAATACQRSGLPKGNAVMTKPPQRLGIQVLIMLTWLASSSVASDLVVIDVPGATGTGPSDINGQGEIVGTFQSNDGHFQGFLWSKGAFIYIDVPGATHTELFGVNDRGDIVGVYYSPDFIPHGFLLEQGVFTSLGELVFPFSINNRGDIVGAHFSPFRAGFLLDANGAFTSFDSGILFDATVKDVNDRGAMVGACCFGTNRFGQGFLISNQGRATYIDIPGVHETNPNGITNRGDIVGWVETISPSLDILRRGFMLNQKKGEFQFIDIPGASSTSILGANNRGDLVGIYSDSTGGHGFVLRK